MSKRHFMLYRYRFFLVIHCLQNVNKQTSKKTKIPSITKFVIYFLITTEKYLLSFCYNNSRFPQEALVTHLSRSWLNITQYKRWAIQQYRYFSLSSFIYWNKFTTFLCSIVSFFEQEEEYKKCEFQRTNWIWTIN